MADSSILHESQVTVAVLAGGVGSRMGQAKANLKLQGVPILRHLLHRLSWAGPRLLITAPHREHPPGHELFDYEALDPIEGQGPLRGILTAIQHLKTPALIAVPVDMPFLNGSHLRWLLEQTNRLPRRWGVLFRRDQQGRVEIESLPCVLRIEARSMVEQQLAKNRRAIHSLLKHEQFTTVPVPGSWPPHVWLNLNTPEDVETYESLNH